MMRYIVLTAALAILTSSCLNRKNAEETNDTADSTDSLPPILETVPPPDTTTGEYLGDCVFDTSTYRFTTEALKKYKSGIRYQWNSHEAEAQTIIGQGDTLWLHIGGCDHFSYSAILSTDIPFKDSSALAGKSLWLARTFFDNGFDSKYEECISKGLFRTESLSEEDVRFFQIIDPDTAVTDHIYNGFSFEKQGSRTVIEIGGYIN